MRSKNRRQKEMIEDQGRLLERAKRIYEAERDENNELSRSLRKLEAKEAAKVREEEHAERTAAPLLTFEIRTLGNITVKVKAHNWKRDHSSTRFSVYTKELDNSKVIAFFPNSQIVWIREITSE